MASSEGGFGESIRGIVQWRSKKRLIVQKQKESLKKARKGRKDRLARMEFEGCSGSPVEVAGGLVEMASPVETSRLEGEIGHGFLAVVAKLLGIGRDVDLEEMDFEITEQFGGIAGGGFGDRRHVAV